MDAVATLPAIPGITTAACSALGLSRASLHRRRTRLSQPVPAEPVARPSPPRALSAPQRQTVLDCLREPRFADLAPAEVYATLLDEGVYHCSIRTMYRILGEHNEVRERRNQLRHPVYTKPDFWPKAPIRSGPGTSPS